MKYAGIRTDDPEKMASFYQAVLPIKEVGRVSGSGSEVGAIFLGAGATALGLLKRAPGGKAGLERVGFQVNSIQEIEERLKKAPPFLYPGEPQIALMKAPSGDPGKSVYLKDPDGNIVELSEEGWAG